MKKAYLSILLLIGMTVLFGIQIGLKGERYATEGVEYYHRGEYKRAIQLFKEADQAANGSVPYYFYWLGRLHIAVEDKDQALLWLDKYVQSGDQEFRRQVDDYIEIMNHQEKAFEKVSLRSMPSYFNSRNSDYGARIDSQGKYLYFTSLRPARQEKENIWRSEIYKSGYGKPQIVSELSTDANEAFGSFSSDGSTAYLFGNYAKGKLDGDIYLSRLEQGNWSKPVALDWLNSPYLDTHPSAFGDSLIFFTSSRPGGVGETDIWVSQKVDGIWTEPVNLGNAINTPGREQTPQLVHFRDEIVHEGKKMYYEETALYFASDTHPGFGGFDLFKAVHKGPTWQDWYLPQNLGLPINSIRDDRYFNLHPGTNEAYISSDRAASGFEKVVLAYVDFTVPGYYVTADEDGDRIYQPILPKDETPSGAGGDIIADAGTKPDEEILPPAPRKLTFRGKLTDEDGRPIQADITFSGIVDGKTYKDVVTSDENGNFNITLPFADPWTVVINPEGYMLYQKDIPAPAPGKDDVTINFVIQRLAPKKVFVFNNIQFDFDSAKLLPQSYPILDDIVITMHNNPEIKIEISGHTCNIGDDDYNLALSTRRAKAVVDYLIKKDVEESRLSYQGYGETKPLNKNKTKAQRALNRRVEVLVVE